MNSLDDKLREKLKFYKEYITGVYQGTSNYDEETAILAIKQAFEDAGYLNVPDIAANLMTGQEFYDRFEKELPWGHNKHHPGGQYVRSTVILAARRASGINEEG